MKSKPIDRKDNPDKIKASINMAIRNTKGENGTTKKPPKNSSNG